MNSINKKHQNGLFPIADQVVEKNSRPLVSIACITYNHEKYIDDAIKGFLMQKTDFPVEIIIHDDASTDTTAKIVKDYAEKYPNIVTSICQDENQLSQGIKPWPNFVFPLARGKYIAFCEGDDFWTDPLKLQKQVEFLEENPNYSLCSHETFYTYINDPNNFRKFAAILFHNFKLDGIRRVKELITLFFSNRKEFWRRRRKHSFVKRYRNADFKIALNTAMSDRYIATMSIVGKSAILKNIPAEMFKLGAGHRLVILWSALHGKMFHMPDVMGFKNTQASSVTVTKVTDIGVTKTDKYLETIKLLQSLKKHSNIENKKALDKKINDLQDQVE